MNNEHILGIYNQLVDLTKRIERLEEAAVRCIPVDLPPEAQSWDGSITVMDEEPPIPKKVIGIDEAGAVMDADAEALGRLADDGGVNEPDQVQNET